MKRRLYFLPLFFLAGTVLAQKQNSIGVLTRLNVPVFVNGSYPGFSQGIDFFYANNHKDCNTGRIHSKNEFNVGVDIYTINSRGEIYGMNLGYKKYFPISISTKSIHTLNNQFFIGSNLKYSRWANGCAENYSYNYNASYSNECLTRFRHQSTHFYFVFGHERPVWKIFNIFFSVIFDANYVESFDTKKNLWHDKGIRFNGLIEIGIKHRLFSF